MDRPLELSDSSRRNYPEHFNVLIENLMSERSKFIKMYTELPKCLKLDYELIHCVALTTALETGFRLENKETSLGFDLRAMRELNSFEIFRDVENESLKATLYLPYFTKWEFRIISVPLLSDLILCDILALEDNEIRFSSSKAVSCSKYLSVGSKGSEIFKDLKGLSEMFTKEFRRMRNETYKKTGFNYYNVLGLPDELKRLIFLELSAKDFVNLCLTSKDMSRFIKDNKIWSYFLLRDYKVITPDESSSYQTYQNITINQVRPVSAENSNYSGTTMETVEEGHFPAGPLV